MRRVIFISIAVGALAVSAAYIQRGYWAVGPEWALPVIAAAIVPLKEEEEEHE